MNEKLIEILMKRDDMTKEEAITAIADCRIMLQAETTEEYPDLDIVIRQELGLEPDFIFDILN